MEGSDMFAAFASESGGALANSRLAQYMSGAAKRTTPAAAASPLQSSLNAPEFVPTSSMHSLNLSGAQYEESPDYAFTATSVNTPQPPPPNGFQAQPPSQLPPAPTSFHEQQQQMMSPDWRKGAGGGVGGLRATVKGGPKQPRDYYSMGYEYTGSESGSSKAVAAASTYAGCPSHLAHYRPRGAAAAAFGASDDIKMMLLNRRQHRLADPGPDLADLNIPAQLEGYTNLVPLEPAQRGQPAGPGFFLSHPSTVYKAVQMKDGHTYALRRVHNCRLLNTKCLARVDVWQKLQHANVVGLRQVFQTKAFGDYSLVFVYDYHAGAETLKTRHFGQPSSGKMPKEASPVRPGGGGGGGPIHGGGGPWKGMDESFIWGYIIQLSSALRTIHSNNMAATTIEPSKILVSGRSKLLVNCCGIMDVLTWEQTQMNPQAVHNFQQDELIGLGRVIVALCCGSLAAAVRENINNSMSFITHHYSTDMKNIVAFLLAPPSPRPKNINDIMPMIGARFYAQLEASQMRMDVLENELAKEVDNGRLFRLLAKMGSVNERPELGGDPSWAETGDRYLLKLFRNHLFHQQTPDGRPWLDLAHVVSALNKLDAGVAERVALASPDAHNLLLVSYADLRRCFAQAFQELLESSAIPQPPINNGMLH